MHIIYDQKSFIFFCSEHPMPILFSERTNESKFYQNCLLQYVISESYSCYWNCKLIASASLATRGNVKVEISSSYIMILFKNVSLSYGNFLTILFLQMAQDGRNWVSFSSWTSRAWTIHYFSAHQGWFPSQTSAGLNQTQLGERR